MFGQSGGVCFGVGLRSGYETRMEGRGADGSLRLGGYIPSYGNSHKVVIFHTGGQEIARVPL